MDLEQKVRAILDEAFEPISIHLDANSGISGYVISNAFEGLESIDRQRLIDEKLRTGGLSREELREVLMISALTPAEGIGIPML